MNPRGMAGEGILVGMAAPVVTGRWGPDHVTAVSGFGPPAGADLPVGMQLRPPRSRPLRARVPHSASAGAGAAF